MATLQIDRDFEKKHIGRTMECYKRRFAEKIQSKVNKYLSKFRVSILLTTNRLGDQELINFSKNLEDYLFEFEDDFDSHLNNHVQLVRNRLNVGHIDVSFAHKRDGENDNEDYDILLDQSDDICFKERRNIFEEETEPIFEERIFIQPQKKCNGLFQISEPEKITSFEPNVSKRSKRRKKKKSISNLQKNALKKRTNQSSGREPFSWMKNRFHSGTTPLTIQKISTTHLKKIRSQRKELQTKSTQQFPVMKKTQFRSSNLRN